VRHGRSTRIPAPASADASFRRYFRVRTGHPAHPTAIVMDAPPSHEDCRPFIHVAKLFGDAGVTVPTVLAQDLEQGFLLLADLGSQTYLSRLDDTSAHNLYTDAAAALVKIQAATRPGELPAYDRAAAARTGPVPAVVHRQAPRGDARRPSAGRPA
jgi:aminoglycoside/choline kinase family phosphotransferase